MKVICLLLSLSLPLLISSAALAQAPAAAAAAAPAAGVTTNDGSYVLGPEDQISLHVVDLEDVSDKPVRIDPSGFIDLPLAGRIHVADLTVEQFRAVLAKSLVKYIDSPQITINVLEYRSQPVSILGAVNTPGVHQLQGPKRLIDVISAAGGLKPDAGTKLTVTRRMKMGVLPLPGARVSASGDFSSADVDLSTLTTGQRPSDNIEVRANDVIDVSKTEVIYVVGEVKKSGSINLNSKEGISLIRALAMAEGYSQSAAPKKAKILRATNGEPTKPEEIPVNMASVMEGKAPDVQLHPNDILFIPNNVSGSAMKRATEAAIQVAVGMAVFGLR
jgi:polysaccharide biosynthesis/export protein